MKFVSVLGACLFAAGLSGAASAQNADAWLVTADEVVRFGGSTGFDTAGPARTRALTLPAIELLQPAASEQKIKAPFPISLRFLPSDAPIVPDTFKVFYGALRLDITDRVAKFVQPSPSGFSIDKAQIPPGRHRLFLQVTDQKQRVAERELRVEVE